MNIVESIKSALSGILGNKMRSVLTMFGIIVGIGSVIMITSVGEGYRVSINKEFEAMGLDKVTIRTDGSNGKKIEWQDMLTNDDVTSLKKYDDILDITAASGTYGFGDAVELLDGEMATAIMHGVDEAYYRMDKSIKIKHGRTITEQDVEAGASVAIISEDFAVQKFGKTDCVGEVIEFNDWGAGLELTVIGVTQSDSSSAMGAAYRWYQELYVPISLIQNVYEGSNTIGSITIKVKNAERQNDIAANAIRIIEMNHGNEEMYRVSSVADMMGEMDSVIGIFTLFMGVVAGISLLVGGIGVMNIMLVSVTERTREIGIRKSLGATNSNIQFQFLIEAVILTAIGGAIGLLFGYGGGKLFSLGAMLLTGMPLEPYISTSVVAMVVAISAGIGIVFGVYPAAKAARLDPIEALRFE
ncbi:ABC transporter permease [Tyzzerella sp. OttesenSCG-928-J15]|nr:ABC transporter permease [Tyzzerella sp. OttesenSCG-928-J15]